MSKVRLHVRVAPRTREHSKPAAAVSTTKPNHAPLFAGDNYRPTVRFTLDVEIPESLVVPPVATVTLPESGGVAVALVEPPL